MYSLYFVALLPPAKLSEQITSLKNYCKAQFGSGHALNSPPHITLHMPFKWKEARKQELIDCLNQVALAHEPFLIQLKDFDYFEPRVVFVNVLENTELRQLQKSLSEQMRRSLHLFNAAYKDRPFHPHMTIAFRDLRKAMFYEAKAYFSTQQLAMEFDAKNLTLLRHRDKTWEVEEQFSMGNKSLNSPND